MSAVDAPRSLERRIVNPWTWQDGFGYSQAVHLRDVTETLVAAGQCSMSEDGAPLHAGDMAAQLALSLDNLEVVLAQAGFALGDVDRLNIYTADVDALFAVWEPIKDRLLAAGCRPTATLLGIDRLAFPELLVEMEATAHR